jgi:hypothetical protein
MPPNANKSHAVRMVRLHTRTVLLEQGCRLLTRNVRLAQANTFVSVLGLAAKIKDANTLTDLY